MQLHTKMEIDAAGLPLHGLVRDPVELLIVPRIQGIQGFAVDIILVGLFRTDMVWIQIVIGIELPVTQGVGGNTALVHGAQLIVYLEIRAI